MLHNHALISSLLLDPWFIDAAYAEMMLPYVINMLEGKTNLSQNPQFIHEKPFPSLLDSDFKHMHLSSAGSSVSTGLFGSATAGNTAVIPIRGAITKYDGYCNNGVESYMQWLDQADESSAETVVVLIDSGGGQANSAFMLAERIRRMQKPTLAYVDSGMAASAAFLIGSACNLFYVSTPVDIVGSIGAMFTLQDFKSNLENTKTWEIYSRLSTEKNAAFRRLRENNDPSLIQDMLDENVYHFIDAVKDYRGDRLVASAGDPFKGASYTAAKALPMGIIDGIAPLNVALTELRNHTKIQPKTISYHTQQPKQNDITEMSWKTSLANWLLEQPDETPEPAATPEAVTAPVTPEATVTPETTPGLPLEQRLAALEEKHASQISAMESTNANLTAQLAAKPAAGPTVIPIAKETVPTPVAAVPEVTSFMSETDELAAKLKAGIAQNQ